MYKRREIASNRYKNSVNDDKDFKASSVNLKIISVSLKCHIAEIMSRVALAYNCLSFPHL